MKQIAIKETDVTRFQNYLITNKTAEHRERQLRKQLYFGYRQSYIK